MELSKKCQKGSKVFQKNVDILSLIFRFSNHNFFFVVLPGDIAWRLYDTYGFPIDLTQLMSEERGMTVDLEAYEKAKAAAILASQGIVF